MADPRRCIGSARFGIVAHEAPVGDFPAQPSQKDGLGRMCKTHWNQYTTALRKAALERTAAEGGTPEGQAAPKPPATAAKPGTRGRAPKPASPKVRKAKATVAASESLGGKADTEAIGSDEVQAAHAASAGVASDATQVPEA